MYLAIDIDVSKGKSTVTVSSIDGTLKEKPFEVLRYQAEINTFLLSFQYLNLPTLSSSGKFSNIFLFLRQFSRDFSPVFSSIKHTIPIY